MSYEREISQKIVDAGLKRIERATEIHELQAMMREDPPADVGPVEAYEQTERRILTPFIPGESIGFIQAEETESTELANYSLALIPNEFSNSDEIVGAFIKVSESNETKKLWGCSTDLINSEFKDMPPLELIQVLIGTMQKTSGMEFGCLENLMASTSEEESSKIIQVVIARLQKQAEGIKQSLNLIASQPEALLLAVEFYVKIQIIIKKLSEIILALQTKVTINSELS